MAQNLRAGDREEVHATVGHRRYVDALRLGVVASRSCLMAVDVYGVPAALLGVVTVSVLDNVGSPWMLATDRAEDFPRAFIAYGRAYTRIMLGEYDVLENHVDARNTRAVAWLKHLGYDVAPAAPHGPLGLPFHQFRIGRT